MTRMLVIALLTMGDPNRLTGGYLYQQRMADEAPRHQARIEFVSLPERPFPLAIADVPAALRRVALLGANALVLDSIAAAYLGPWLLVREPGPGPTAPLLGMLHQPTGGMEHGPVRTTLQRALDRLAYRRARLLLVSSQSLAEEVVAGGVPREKIRVVPPGRDLVPSPMAGSDGMKTPSAAVNGGSSPSMPSGPPFTAAEGVTLSTSYSSSAEFSPPSDLRHGRRMAILCVGNWVERKGIHCLLDAFARLPADAATLHLVGDDRADPRYARRLRARLACPDLTGRVVVHGSLSPERVAALYHTADIFALPSFVEPFGMVYAEAMAAGLPVVGWRAGNLPYLIEDGREGLLVAPDDVNGLAQALTRMAEDEGLRRRLGDAAWRRAQELPTWEESARLFFEAVREVLEPVRYE